MRKRKPRYIVTPTLRLSLAILALFVTASSSALAEDSLGFYIGGAIGQSRVEAKETACFCDLGEFIATDTIDKRHLAFQAMLGLRPTSLIGAEIDYVDLGKPDGEAFGFPSSASIKGAAAFGVLYLPVPIVEPYFKVGVARLESAVNYSYCSPCACNYCLNSIQLDRTNTTGAGGAGVEYKFRSWALRGEYERFSVVGEHPSLLSVGFTWKFL